MANIGQGFQELDISLFNGRIHVGSPESFSTERCIHTVPFSSFSGFFFFGLAIWQIDLVHADGLLEIWDWKQLKDLQVQKRNYLYTTLSLPFAYGKGLTYRLILQAKSQIMFIKLNIISLYSKPHSFVTNEYNKHQCTVNLQLQTSNPKKLFLLIAEHWNWDVSLDAIGLNL